MAANAALAEQRPPKSLSRIISFPSSILFLQGSGVYGALLVARGVRTYESPQLPITDFDVAGYGSTNGQQAIGAPLAGHFLADADGLRRGGWSLALLQSAAVLT